MFYTSYTHYVYKISCLKHCINLNTVSSKIKLEDEFILCWWRLWLMIRIQIWERYRLGKFNKQRFLFRYERQKAWFGKLKFCDANRPLIIFQLLFYFYVYLHLFWRFTGIINIVLPFFYLCALFGLFVDCEHVLLLHIIQSWTLCIRKNEIIFWGLEQATVNGILHFLWSFILQGVLY